MHATSTLPDTWPAGSPLLEPVRDDVWALAQPMSQAYLRYSFAYLLRDTDGWLHVIDPGSEWRIPANDATPPMSG